MSKKFKFLILSILSVLLVVSLITTVMFVFADDLEYGTIVELITKEKEVIHPESVVEEDIRFPQTLSVQQKEQVVAEYTEKLDEVYSIRCQKRATYKQVMETKLAQSIDYVRRDTIDSGVFEVNLISKETVDGIVKARLETVTWFKYITEPQQPAEKAYAVIFPVTKKTSDYEFEKTDDGWRILSCEAVESIPTQMEGDYDIEKSFDTYEEALEYALATNPENIFEVETQSN